MSVQLALKRLQNAHSLASATCQPHASFMTFPFLVSPFFPGPFLSGDIAARHAGASDRVLLTASIDRISWLQEPAVGAISLANNLRMAGQVRTGLLPQQC